MFFSKWYLHPLHILLNMNYNLDLFLLLFCIFFANNCLTIQEWSQPFGLAAALSKGPEHLTKLFFFFFLSKEWNVQRVKCKSQAWITRAPGWLKMLFNIFLNRDWTLNPRFTVRKPGSLMFIFNLTWIFWFNFVLSFLPVHWWNCTGRWTAG